jgi:hypothetical protein
MSNQTKNPAPPKESRPAPRPEKLHEKQLPKYNDPPKIPPKKK